MKIQQKDTNLKGLKEEVITNFVEEASSSKLAQKILQYAYHLDPDFISLNIFQELLIIDKDELKIAVDILESSGAVRRTSNILDEQGLRMHRLMQESILIKNESFCEIKLNLLKTLDDLFSWDIVGDDVKKSDKFLAMRYAPHIQKLLKTTENLEPVNQVAAKLNIKMGDYCKNLIHNYNCALQHYNEGLEMARTIHNDQPHPDLAQSLNNLGYTYKKLGQDEKGNEYLRQAKEMEKVLNRNPEGEGLENYESLSYWNKYSKEGIEQLLKLRIESSNIENIEIKSSKVVWNGDVGAEELCADIVDILDTEQGLTLLPLNLYYKHWVGIVIDKNDAEINLHYMDPEQQAIPALLKEKLAEVLNLSYPKYQISIIDTELEPQKYNNCGPEVIENFIWYLTGSRLDQDDAVPVHNLLFEDAIVLAGDCI